jgi:hypothetical protein
MKAVYQTRRDVQPCALESGFTVEPWPRITSALLGFGAMKARNFSDPTGEV